MSVSVRIVYNTIKSLVQDYKLSYLNVIMFDNIHQYIFCLIGKDKHWKG